MNENEMVLKPDEITLITLLRRCNIDAELLVTKRDGRVVGTKITDTYVKEFQAPVTRIRESVVL